MTAYLLAVALLAPPGVPSSVAPQGVPSSGTPSLGQALREVGAFDPAVDHSLDPPPPPARVGAQLLVLGGIAAITAGLLGMILSPGCVTWDAQGRCVHNKGSDDLYPALMVIGLGVTTTGAYWMRQDLRPEDR